MIPLFGADFETILNIPDSRQALVFEQYKQLVNHVDNMDEVGNVLELGSGYSTVLWALLAEKRKLNVFSVDTGFDTVHKAIEGTEFKKIVNQNITFLQGPTISSEEFLKFYDSLPLENLGGVSLEAIKKSLKNYIVELIDLRKWEKLSHVYGRKISVNSAIELFFNDDGMILPQNIIDIYRQKGDEVDFYSSKKQFGKLDELLKSTNIFDAIFFDCGEFSAFPEWLKMKDHIRIGGIVAFHDIYFPKSFKNFMVCAAVDADPSWKIKHLDKSTSQGLMIAMRVK